MDKFKHLLTELTSLLKAYGYSKKGNTFFLNGNGNWGLIEFQKSKSNLPGTISFTINIGVFSSVLWEKLGYGKPKEKPDTPMCQWTMRIGFLMPQKKDHWWQINDQHDIKLIIDEISKVLVELGIPQVNLHLSDEGLINAWLNKESGGLTDYMRLMNLVTLLKLKDNPILPATIKELRSIAKDSAMVMSINEHLTKLGIHE